MTDDEWRIMYVPLREYVEQRLTDMEKAVIESRRLMESRMDGVPQEYVRKGELNECVIALSAKVDQLMEFKSQIQGMASQQELTRVRWVALASMLVGLGGLIVHLWMSR